jgi:hypothetical protein
MQKGFIKNLIAAVKNSPATAVAERIMLMLNLGTPTTVGAYVPAQKFKVCHVEEVLVFAGDAFKALTTSLPANAEVYDVALNFDTAVVLVTATKLGVGIAGSPSSLLLSGVAVTKNTKNQAVPADAGRRAGSAAVALRVSAVDNAGAAAGTVTSGSVRVRVTYGYADALADAA